MEAASVAAPRGAVCGQSLLAVPGAVSGSFPTWSFQRAMRLRRRGFPNALSPFHAKLAGSRKRKNHHLDGERLTSLTQRIFPIAKIVGHN
jgi:hypothetical protein